MHLGGSEVPLLLLALLPAKEFLAAQARSPTGCFPLLQHDAGYAFRALLLRNVQKLHRVRMKCAELPSLASAAFGAGLSFLAPEIGRAHV